MYEYYYPLDVTIFMNEKDRDITESLWTKYWKSSIIQTPLTGSNYDEFIDNLLVMTGRANRCSTESLNFNYQIYDLNTLVNY